MWRHLIHLDTVFLGAFKDLLYELNLFAMIQERTDDSVSDENTCLEKITEVQIMVAATDKVDLGFSSQLCCHFLFRSPVNHLYGKRV